MIAASLITALPLACGRDDSSPPGTTGASDAGGATGEAGALPTIGGRASGGETTSGGETSGGEATTGGAATSGGRASGGISSTGGASTTGGRITSGGIPGATGGRASVTGGQPSQAGGTAEAGAAGETGGSVSCGPNPAGCRQSGCPAGQDCVITSGACKASSCTCDASSGSWVCTDDCQGGACVMGGLACIGEPNPGGCITDANCPSGEHCAPPEDDACIPQRCVCDPFQTGWSCEDDCGGGECVPD